MYEGIRRVKRFVRGLISPAYRFDCYYKKFDDEWKKLHRCCLSGLEVEARIHHRDEEDDECSLVKWILNFGKI